MYSLTVFIESYQQSVGENVCKTLIITLITRPSLARKTHQLDITGLKLFLFPDLKVPWFNDQEFTYVNFKLFPKIFSITATDKSILT